MATQEFDVVVIGSGPGGYVAAIRCSQLGLKTAVVEKDALGGVCLNWGCIPTKALIKSAERYHHMKANPGGLFTFDNLGYDWDAIIRASRATTEQMSKGVAFLMKKNQIEVIAGKARYLKPDLIEVEAADGSKSQVKAKNSILASGAKPASLPGVAIDGKSVISSREAMVLPERPKSMIVVGAGAIGLEFAYFYNAFGTEVTILEYLPNLLPVADADVCKDLERAFKRQGIKFHLGAAVKSVEGGPGSVKATFELKGKAETIEADLALMAIGVRPNVENLGLEEIGVETGRGGVKVNAHCQTSVPNIYAIGDVIGQPALAHAASAEAMVAAEAIKGERPRPIDYLNVPACVYCQPQVGSVGMTEKQARDSGQYDVHVAKFPFQVNGKSVATGETAGFVKIVADKKYGEILGAHVIGSEATELIAELALARANELTVHEIHDTVHAHPTQSEATMEAAGVWLGHPIHI